MNHTRSFQRKVDRYDGQVIWIDGEACYEIGNYLGGGAAGVVYEGVDLQADPTTCNVAIKCLNPVGFKLMPSGPLQRCLVAVKGASISGETRGMPLREDNVWWLVHPNSKQVIAAYEDPKYGTLREVPLPKCIEIWGWDGMGGGSYDDSSSIDEVLEKLSSLKQDVTVDGVTVTIPRIPPKYVKWLRSRRSIYREISNMRKLGSHSNVIKLHEVLELIQDSKSTLFLVLELVTGGELFDRIKIGCGTTEDMARRYFRQLLSGVGCCHARGVCHRDLKPENLLLSDGSEGAVLKIADFGLSAAFAIAAGGGDVMDETKAPAVPPMVCQNVRRLRSVVGSPHYIAPEVTTESVQGYDGTKADAWSAGVILYAMVVGSLPFGKELSQCPRFQRFRRWAAGLEKESLDGSGLDTSPAWLFPQNVSLSVRGLIVGLLHPDPHQRVSIEAAVRHPWVSETTADVNTILKGFRQLELTAPASAASSSQGAMPPPPPPKNHHHAPPQLPPPVPRAAFPFDKPAEGGGGSGSGLGSPMRSWN